MVTHTLAFNKPRPAPALLQQMDSHARTHAHTHTHTHTHTHAHTHTHTHTRTHTHTHSHTHNDSVHWPGSLLQPSHTLQNVCFDCVCVSVSVSVRKRNRERESICLRIWLAFTFIGKGVDLLYL